MITSLFDNGTLDPENLLHLSLPSILGGQYDWSVSENYFSEMPVEIRAICDFSSGSHIYLRPEILDALTSAKGETYQNAAKVICHEVGHACIPAHKNRVVKWNNCGVQMSHAVAFGNSYSNEFQRELKKTEDEADIFMLALLVPIRELDGSLSLEQLARRYNVCIQTAYEADLLCKDYNRQEMLKNRENS